VPTNDDTLLSSNLTDLDAGMGRFTLGPGVGIIWAPVSNFFFGETFLFRFDIDGNAHQDIQQLQARWFMMYAWQNGLYVMPEFHLLSDFFYEHRDYAFGSEFGYTANNTTFFVSPNTGRDASLISRDWGIAFGFRYNY
jgi:hypothetical protein